MSSNYVQNNLIMYYNFMDGSYNGTGNTVKNLKTGQNDMILVNNPTYTSSKTMYFKNDSTNRLANVQCIIFKF